jgi:hypothetical protein
MLHVVAGFRQDIGDNRWVHVDDSVDSVRDLETIQVGDLMEKLSSRIAVGSSVVRGWSGERLAAATNRRLLASVQRRCQIG